MDWEIGFSRQANKFLAQRHLPDEFAVEPIRRAIRRLRGESITVDLKRLSGKWKGCIRIRIGKIRIIFSIDEVAHKALIEVIDNRGSAYR